jgi:hypothetical protein
MIIKSDYTLIKASAAPKCKITLITVIYENNKFFKYTACRRIF